MKENSEIKREFIQDLDRINRITSLLFRDYNNPRDILNTSETNGLVYVFDKTNDREILPLYANNSLAYTSQNGSYILFNNTFGEDIMRHCKAYASIRNPINPTFSTQGGPRGNLAFVANERCVCPTGVVIPEDILPEILSYGPMFQRVNLDGETVEFTMDKLNISRGRELYDLLNLSEEERVREFTQMFLESELSEEQLTRIHLIPTWDLEKDGRGNIYNFLKRR